MSVSEPATPGSVQELDDHRIREGWKLLETLDAQGHGPDTAFWIWFRDVEDWRLMFSGGDLLRYGHKAAKRRAESVLAELAGTVDLAPEQIGVAREGAKSVALIEQAIQTGPGIHGIRIKNNVVGGQRIRRAYVYRVM